MHQVFQHHQVSLDLPLAQLVLEDLQSLKILHYLLVPAALEGPEILGLRRILRRLYFLVILVFHQVQVIQRVPVVLVVQHFLLGQLIPVFPEVLLDLLILGIQEFLNHLENLCLLSDLVGPEVLAVLEAQTVQVAPSVP